MKDTYTGWGERKRTTGYLTFEQEPNALVLGGMPALFFYVLRTSPSLQTWVVDILSNPT